MTRTPSFSPAAPNFLKSAVIPSGPSSERYDDGPDGMTAACRKNFGAAGERTWLTVERERVTIARPPHTVLYLDFETHSALDLELVGARTYAEHPSTQVLMLAWAVGDDPVQLWNSVRCGHAGGAVRRRGAARGPVRRSQLPVRSRDLAHDHGRPVWLA